MRFSLHVFFALGALVLVSAAAALGAEQGFATATPGGLMIEHGQYQQAANTAR